MENSFYERYIQEVIDQRGLSYESCVIIFGNGLIDFISYTKNNRTNRVYRSPSKRLLYSVIENDQNITQQLDIDFGNTFENFRKNIYRPTRRTEMMSEYDIFLGYVDDLIESFRSTRGAFLKKFKDDVIGFSNSNPQGDF